MKRHVLHTAVLLLLCLKLFALAKQKQAILCIKCKLFNINLLYIELLTKSNNHPACCISMSELLGAMVFSTCKTIGNETGVLNLVKAAEIKGLSMSAGVAGVR